MFCPDCGTWNRAVAPICTRCTVALPEIATAGNGEAPDEGITALRRQTGSRYRIIRRLGSGGMAHVYYAEHGRLGRPLAVKVLHPTLSREPEMRERFRREAESAAQLSHPYICPILDYGERDEAVYLVLPFYPGGSLAERIARERTMPPAAASVVAVQVACALDYAHRRGVVHRDVKPDNVLFDEDGNAVLTDFGIATARFHGRLTGTGRAMGTPHYMSPEQAMGRMLDGRSDLYAVGVMLYEMVLGIPPFDGADAYSVGYKHVHEPPVAPDVIDSRTSPSLAAVMMKCLSKTPSERYQRGHELADALLGFLREAETGTPEARSAWVARRTGGMSKVTP